MRRLEVLDWAGPRSWRWRLTDDKGAFLADHVVDVAGGVWQFDAFTDLHRYLKWNAAPDRRLAHETELVSQVGGWVGQHILGGISTALVATRGPVRMELPEQAAVLGYLPWELARVNGRTLAGHRVSMVVVQQPHQSLAKADVGERLRMLAVFSLPEGSGALNLRKERFELARLVHRIAKVNNKAIELRVLQYGATRQRLEEALLEEPGWDVVHLSGHGLPSGLVLEDDTGRHDLISSTELVDLLDLAGEQIKLVTLSACESAAVTATQHLQHLGLGPALRDTDPGDDPGAEPAPLPAVAAAIVTHLDCAVLAMRYPVVDDFATALAGSFYDLLLGKGQPVSRALGLSLTQQKVIPPVATPGTPALSAGTPALFGPRAVDLTLTAPSGRPPVLPTQGRGLADFPDQPERFVGRVGVMTRAAAALAPESGRSGVVFHGMAGAGKTACALELAYSHQESFPSLVWYQAPPEGHDIATALTDFALALERQFPFVTWAHLVSDHEELQNYLPVLTQTLEQERALVVLDNVESLLTADGGWRDQRWALVMAAMVGHGGLSRVVVTSRRLPAGLGADASGGAVGGVLAEAVHALSLREAVLLAREWPGLRGLMDGVGLPAGMSAEDGRGLAARVLAVVQGHPKLIELANGVAADPVVLRSRLDEADRTWLTRGTRLDEFLAGGEPAASDADYVQVLQGWARSTTAGLPAAAGLLFSVICCVEEADREPQVIAPVWPVVWRRLGRAGEAPELGQAVGVLVERALVDAEVDPGSGGVVRWRVHPGVAEAGRAGAGDEVAAVVDDELGDFWLAQLRLGRGAELEGLGWLVVRAATSAAPYLLRRHRWGHLNATAAQVLTRDSTVAAAARLVPMLAAAVEATRGSDQELDLARTHARAVTTLDPGRGEGLLEELLGVAVAGERYTTAAGLAADLLIRYRDRGRFGEALVLADRLAEYNRRSGYGRWTQLSVQVWRLQILRLQGQYRQVWDAVQELRQRMAEWGDQPDPTDVVIAWNVRETLFNVGMSAARDLGLWQQALELNAEDQASKRARGASDAELAFGGANDYGPLLRLGRLGEARELLIRCREVFEATNNIPSLGKTLGALAEVEDKAGHRDRAVALQIDALRLTYMAGDPETIEVSHHNLANYLHQLGGDGGLVWAHLLAATVIGYQTGTGHLSLWLPLLGRMLADDGGGVPGSFAVVCQAVQQYDRRQLEGIRLAELVEQLPRRAADGEAAMREVLRLAEQVEAERRAELVAGWEPVLSALHNAVNSSDREVREQAAAALDAVLTPRADQPDWAALVVVLRRIHAGERDPEQLLADLDDIDTTIARRALDVLAGTATVDPTAWHTDTDPDADTPEDAAG